MMVVNNSSQYFSRTEVARIEDEYDNTYEIGIYDQNPDKFEAYKLNIQNNNNINDRFIQFLLNFRMKVLNNFRRKNISIDNELFKMVRQEYFPLFEEDNLEIINNMYRKSSYITNIFNYETNEYDLCINHEVNFHDTFGNYTEKYLTFKLSDSVM